MISGLVRFSKKLLDLLIFLLAIIKLSFAAVLNFLRKLIFCIEVLVYNAGERASSVYRKNLGRRLFSINFIWIPGSRFRRRASPSFSHHKNLVVESSCENLRASFYDLKETRDVAEILNIRYEYLVYIIYKRPLSKQYTRFGIPKKTTGSTREIFAPSSTLKILQRKLSQVLYCVYEPKPCVHGFTPQRSILTNAQAHTKKRYILNIDLLDFFPSINFGRVRGLFIARPYGLTPKASTVLAQICCYENQLPQGAPTSPIVSNMICAKMDSQLQRLAKACKCTYTRYADDITFSTTLPVFPVELALVVSESNGENLILGEPLVSIVETNGFKINSNKVRLQRAGEHQEVTGLTVNEFPNVNRHYVRQIRAILHAWEKHGIEAAQQKYLEKYVSNNFRGPNKGVPPLPQVLIGKIFFLRMVRGRDNEICQKFLDKYNYLSKRDF